MKISALFPRLSIKLLSITGLALLLAQPVLAQSFSLDLGDGPSYGTDHSIICTDDRSKFGPVYFSNGDVLHTHRSRLIFSQDSHGNTTNSPQPSHNEPCLVSDNLRDDAHSGKIMGSRYPPLYRR